MNVLGWHHTQPDGKNARLDDGVVRMRQQVAMFDAHGVGIVGLNEMESFQARTLAATPNWNFVMSGANNKSVGGRPGNWMANVIGYRHDLYELVSLDNLRSAMAGRAVGLNMPGATFREKETGVEFCVLCVHMPRLEKAGTPARQVSVDARRSAVAVHTQWIKERGHDVLVVGDLNSRSLARTYGSALQVGVQADIDFVLGTEGVEFDRAKIESTQRTSDHPTWGYVDATVSSVVK